MKMGYATKHNTTHKEKIMKNEFNVKMWKTMVHQMDGYVTVVYARPWDEEQIFPTCL